MECMVCNRMMVISRGTICKTCDDILMSQKISHQTSEMIIETIGEFSLFENGPKNRKFVRRDVMRKKKNEDIQ